MRINRDNCSCIVVVNIKCEVGVVKDSGTLINNCMGAGGGLHSFVNYNLTLMKN